LLRVIVCTAGWTGSQISAVNKHNKQHHEQPILLADASAREALFGPRSAEAIERRIGQAQGFRPASVPANPHWVIKSGWC
jgi:hypothetical protein